MYRNKLHKKSPNELVTIQMVTVTGGTQEISRVYLMVMVQLILILVLNWQMVFWKLKRITKLQQQKLNATRLLLYLPMVYLVTMVNGVALATMMQEITLLK